MKESIGDDLSLCASISDRRNLEEPIICTMTMPPPTPRHAASSPFRMRRDGAQPSVLNDPDDPDNTSEQEDASIDKPILAISYKNKFLGAAFWNPTESTLVGLADIQCANVIDMLDLGISSLPTTLTELVKVQTSPALILVPSGVEEAFLKALQPSLADTYTISIRPQSEFNFEKAKNKVLKLADLLPHADRISLEIPDDVLSGEGEKLVRMGGVMEWHKRNSVGPLAILEINE